MFNVITGFIKMYHRFYISYILKYTFAHVSSNNKYKYVIYMYEFNHKKRANQAGKREDYQTIRVAMALI